MTGQALWVFLMLAACCSVARADDAMSKQIAAAGLREAREIIATDLFGHYDITKLAVLSIGAFPDRARLEHDYGLATVVVAFSARRNVTRHPNLNPAMFEPGSPMCKGWLYLHCGVPVGHVFDGKLRLLLAADRSGSWRTVSPQWRSRREYSLHGYLLLDGRRKEGYVVFDEAPGR